MYRNCTTPLGVSEGGRHGEHYYHCRRCNTRLDKKGRLVKSARYSQLELVKAKKRGKK